MPVALFEMLVAVVVDDDVVVVVVVDIWHCRMNLKTKPVLVVSLGLAIQLVSWMDVVVAAVGAGSV